MGLAEILGLFYLLKERRLLFLTRTAILVDGGFYRKRAAYLWGQKTAEERARELTAYCWAHLHNKDGGERRHLYRIFYYDCEPLDKTVYHPFLKRNVVMKNSETYTWTLEFLNELREKRKFALRLGEFSSVVGYNLRASVTKELLMGKRTLEDLKEDDFIFTGQQKGVDMKIGIDIASLAYKKQVDQIILISGDSDFVPAAKLARREGIDFILDPMWAKIKPNLFEHIDGLASPWKKKDGLAAALAQSADKPLEAEVPSTDVHSTQQSE